MIYLITPILFNFTILQASFYHPVAEQCWGDPTITASGAKIDLDNVQQWCALVAICWSVGAVSMPMVIHLTLWTLQGVEKWVVQDCMAARFTQKIDFLMPVGKRKNGRFALILN
jgi:tellurite resistance protein TehA-like permease